jgi:DHA2 family multidrug resistance protein
LKDLTFASGSFIGAMLGLGLFASLFLLPQFMQVLLGFTATQSGLILMPRSIAMMVIMPISGMLYNRMGPKAMISLGLCLSVYSQWVMGHFNLQTGTGDFLLPQVLQGIGFGFVFVSLSTAALSNTPREQLTSASGLYNLIRQLGGSFGTAIVVTMLTRHTQDARVAILNYVNVATPGVGQRVGGMAGAFTAHGYSSATAHAMALSALNGLVNRQATMIAYDYTFLAIGLLFIICIPTAFLLKVPRYQPDQAAVDVV